MHKFSCFLGIALLLVTLRPTSGVAATTHDSLQQAVTLNNKVILPETSIDGPAFVSDRSIVNGQDVSTTIIAWTGTDPAHHLNLLTSVNQTPNPPLQFDQKLILNETSPFRPALFQSGAPSGSGNVVVLAWTGTDSHHSLNVLWNAYGNPSTIQKKLTLFSESSISSPGLTSLFGMLYISWTGTDSNHSLNVLPLSIPDLTPGAKIILPQFSSAAGPNMTVLSHVTSNPLILNWTMTTQHLNLAGSSDGVQFTSIFGSGGSPQLSAAAPDTLSTQIAGVPAAWIAWTGTDAGHHLNLQWTTQYPQWPDPAMTKTVLSDSAIGGPQIASGAGLLIAWTGTDAAHHLNVAEVLGP